MCTFKQMEAKIVRKSFVVEELVFSRPTNIIQLYCKKIYSQELSRDWANSLSIFITMKKCKFFEINIYTLMSKKRLQYKKKF